MSATADIVLGRVLLRRELRALVGLAVPIVVGKLSLMGQNTVDVLLAGHLSAHVLGAVAMGAGVWWMAQMALAGLLMTVSPSVSQLDGAGRRGDVAPVFVQALWIALIAGAALILVVRFALPALVEAMGVASALHEDVRAYLHAISWAAPAVGIVAVCTGVSEGLSMPRPGMVFGLAALALLAPLGFALMYGMGLGARGSGIANAIVVWLQAVGFMGWIAVSGDYRGLGWAPRWRPSLGQMTVLLRLGVPMAVSQLLESGLFTTAGLLVGGFGTAAAASHSVALNCCALFFMMPLGLAFAATVRVGNAAGRGDRAGIRRAGLAGIAACVGVQLVSAFAFLTAPHLIAGLFADDAEVIARAAILLQLAAAFQLADGLQVASISALRGLKDTSVPMLITLVGYWCAGLPLALLCAYGFGWEAPGVWMGLIGGLVIVAGLLLHRFLRVSRV